MWTFQLEWIVIKKYFKAPIGNQKTNSDKIKDGSKPFRFDTRFYYYYYYYPDLFTVLVFQL